MKAVQGRQHCLVHMRQPELPMPTLTVGTILTLNQKPSSAASAQALLAKACGPHCGTIRAKARAKEVHNRPDTPAVARAQALLASAWGPNSPRSPHLQGSCPGTQGALHLAPQDLEEPLSHTTSQPSE